MKRTLIVTEKPSQARDFAIALMKGRYKKNNCYEDEHYLILWAVGHLFELKEPEDYDPVFSEWSLEMLPIIPAEFGYKPISRTADHLTVIRDKLQSETFGKIINAGDAGREGELIVSTLLRECGIDPYGPGVYRFWTSRALTPEVVREGVKTAVASSQYHRLFEAGSIRQKSDWMAGINFTRACSVKMNNGVFSIGRVQTCVLAMVVNRHRERENFVPQKYWIVRADFEGAEGSWTGIWQNSEGKTKIESVESALSIVTAVSGKDGRIISVDTEKKTLPPPYLFNLGDLQMAAHKEYSMTASRSLEALQACYEQKAVSYPRTEARMMAVSDFSLVQGIVEQLGPCFEIFQGIDPSKLRPENKRVFNDHGVTDHHGLIPLGPLPADAGENERKVYGLVLTRFAAAFYPDYVYDQTVLLSAVGENVFKSVGKVITSMGWKALYAEEKEDRDSKLPHVKEGEAIQCLRACKEDKQTRPPEAFTDAGILKAMANPTKYMDDKDSQAADVFKGTVGIGTQATRTRIIETLIEREYVKREGKILMPTAKGFHLIDYLQGLEVLCQMTSPDITGVWETQLEHIASGEGDSAQFMKAMAAFVTAGIEELKNTATEMFQKESIGDCPSCGGNIIVKKKGFGCANFQQTGCSFFIPEKIAGKKIRFKQVRQILQKGKTEIIEGFRSTKGKEFAAALKVSGNQIEGTVRIEFCFEDMAGERIGQCPDCGQDVVEKSRLYGCVNSECRFCIWKIVAGRNISRPVAEQLLCSGTTELIEGFQSKKKQRTFSAMLSLEKQPDHSSSVKFLFQ